MRASCCVEVVCKPLRDVGCGTEGANSQDHMSMCVKLKGLQLMSVLRCLNLPCKGTASPRFRMKHVLTDSVVTDFVVLSSV